SPAFSAATAPASVAAFTAPTSPRTITVTKPPPISRWPRICTFAALTIASAASIAPTRPFVSIKPSAPRSAGVAAAPVVGGMSSSVSVWSSGLAVADGARPDAGVGDGDDRAVGRGVRACGDARRPAGGDQDDLPHARPDDVDRHVRGPA